MGRTFTHLTERGDRVTHNQSVFKTSFVFHHIPCTCIAPEPWPGGANTRFSAPHFPHFASMRVCPCLTLTVFRSNASFTKRSISSVLLVLTFHAFFPGRCKIVAGPMG